jgi:palmitoyltransferase
LNDCGYDKEGNLKILPLGLTMFVHNKSVLSKFFFLWPFLTLFVTVWILSHWVIYIGMPGAIVVVFGMQYLAQRVANNGPGEFRMLQRTVSSELHWCWTFFPLTVDSHTSPDCSLGLCSG